jgi:hypothetical protein
MRLEELDWEAAMTVNHQEYDLQAAQKAFEELLDVPTKDQNE